jgi:pyruvate,water dikinase
VLNTPFPPELEAAISSAYLRLCERYNAVNGDLEGEAADECRNVNSDLDRHRRRFARCQLCRPAGNLPQRPQRSPGDGVLQKVFCLLFTDRAISYRQTKGFDHFEVALSVCVQKMVRSDLATSGVMFSIDTETGFKNAVLITAAYGLGENVVQGTVNPDEYRVFKPTLKDGHSPILSKRLGSKALRMVYDTGGTKLVKNVSVPPAEQQAIRPQR